MWGKGRRLGWGGLGLGENSPQSSSVRSYQSSSVLSPWSQYEVLSPRFAVISTQVRRPTTEDWTTEDWRPTTDD
jgi:hypothetical protein